jgi:hypothetical protein
VNELIAQLLRASQHRFIGRLARDPEMRYFESGSYVCNCRMLINKPGAKKDDGQEPDGFKLELWNQQAQAFADAAHKGDLVDVSGRVKTEAWTDRTTGEEAPCTDRDGGRLQGDPPPGTRTASAGHQGSSPRTGTAADVGQRPCQRWRRLGNPVLIMETLTKARQQLDALLLELEQRETATAQAMETLTVDAQVRAAWAEATKTERWRVLALIDQQIAQLNGAGMNTILLRTLRGVVADG